ncbi:MAG: [NiFe]-hydrogenase assembly chaperone HybE [Candidatus Competibacterales bacterium]|nr:[NiFe]-hydrogenase assembly chaperone HybE [Candidatus Competibacterales bacterium]
MNRPPCPTCYHDDPSPLLESVFSRIQRERMQDIPLLNPALRVAAVGFRRWEGRWLGVLLTPWFLNLMLLPADPQRWETLAEGEKRRLPLPSGDYPFSGGHEPAIGPYLFCSLLSPVHALPDQSTALRIAGETMDLLLQPTVDRGPPPESAPASPCGRTPVPVSRRDLLGGFGGLAARR